MTDNLHFRVGMREEAMGLVRKHHYSGRWPSNVQCVGSLHEHGGLFGDYGPIMAACVFSIPPTRWTEDVWELSRLVRNDQIMPLTSLISQTLKHINRSGAINLVVSFADWTQRHHGGIYQAASWRYSGKREIRMDGVVWRGTFIPGRSANNRWGTQSPDLLAKQGIECEPHYDEGKHLYWKALNRKGRQKAARLELNNLPYPKPAGGDNVQGHPKP